MAGWWSKIKLPFPGSHDVRSFDAMVLPHLSSGYNLARWLTRDDTTAEDVVQDACVRALRYFGSLRGDDARAWFLRIVRNACFEYLGRSSTTHEVNGLDDLAMEVLQVAAGQISSDPAQTFDRERERARVNDAIRALPPPLREVIVLRELEQLGYAEISAVAGVPIGTVMSRLSRARTRLRSSLAPLNTHR